MGHRGRSLCGILTVVGLLGTTRRKEPHPVYAGAWGKAGEGGDEHRKPPEGQQERLLRAVKIRTFRDKGVKKNIYQKAIPRTGNSCTIAVK